MEDFSLIEKMSLLVNIILSSPLFLFCTTLAVALLIFYIISIKKYKKVNKWIFISVWSILVLIIIINYNKLVFGIIDNLFDAFFKMLYFPSVTMYTIILLITNLAFFYSILSKKVKTSNKVLNFINALLLDVFLILVIDVVSKNNINVYEEISVYTNTKLLILLELTSAIFVSWVLISLLLSAHRKLRKYDEKEYPKMPEIIFDEVR